MNFKRIILLLVLSAFTIFIYSCGQKLDLNEIDVKDDNVNIGGDTVYIQLNPVWEGYNKP
ncbi:MAG TPA: hypothetical protein ENH47_00450 [Ignavibacteriales bacterium]|nr:hypothetical protein [Ignavibacteriales bacterium]